MAFVFLWVRDVFQSRLTLPDSETDPNFRLLPIKLYTSSMPCTNCNREVQEGKTDVCKKFRM